MSAQERNDGPEWPEGVIAVRVGPGANCSSMGSSIQLMWAAAVLGGVISIVASALLAPRECSASKDKGEDARDPDDRAST